MNDIYDNEGSRDETTINPDALNSFANAVDAMNDKLGAVKGRIEETESE